MGFPEGWTDVEDEPSETPVVPQCAEVIGRVVAALAAGEDV